MRFDQPASRRNAASAAAINFRSQVGSIVATNEPVTTTGFFGDTSEYFLIVELRADVQTGEMHKAQGMERIVLWSAMVSSLRSCFGCSTLLGIVSKTDGFCEECTERSRRCRKDDLGGES